MGAPQRKSSDAHGQAQILMNTHVVLSGDAIKPPIEKENGPRIKDRFSPTVNNAADSELSQVLVNELRKKSREEKLDIFGEIVYSHSLC